MRVAGSDSSQDEELVVQRPGRAVWGIVAACALVVATLAVSRLMTGSHGAPPKPPPTSTAQSATVQRTSGDGPTAAGDALITGTSAGVRSSGGTTILDAELINDTNLTVSVDYPIQLGGAGRVPPASALTGLAVKVPDVLGAARSAGLPRIAAHQHIVVWIAFHPVCERAPKVVAWPAAESTIAIHLAGFPTPATYTFEQVFGLSTLTELNRICRA